MSVFHDKGWCGELPTNPDPGVIKRFVGAAEVFE
jgi:hypothetical protein